MRLSLSLMLGILMTPMVVMSQTIVINEFMASNTGSVVNETGEDYDWVELYNPTAEAVNLAGYYLSDRIGNRTKWQFPVNQPDLTTIEAGGYLVVWASGENGTPTELHADFKLDADGEALILTESNGLTVLDQIQFGAQSEDVSFGRAPDGSDNWRYMQEPTLGQINSEGYLGWLEPVQFSVERGFYDESFTVSLSVDTPDTEIWVTTDTNVPHDVFIGHRGAEEFYGQIYTQPITISKTTCLRAVAVKTDWCDSSVVTHSYLFTADIITQPARPEGFPLSWISKTVDYAMDQDVVESHRDEIEDDLKSTPIVSIVLPNDDLFGDEGIYSHATRKGRDWEREASMEWIDPNLDDPNMSEHFGVNAGLRVQGGDYARASSRPKVGLQFFFRGEYGPTKLEYPLFPDTEVQTFDRLALRQIWNYSFVGDSGGYGPDYLRDVFSRDTVRDMKGLTPHGRPIQLYLNGLYWGLYIMTERVDETFASEHLGGEDDDYDILEAPNSQGGGTTMKVADGNEITALQDWETLFALARMDLLDPNTYDAIGALLDLPAMIDYMLMIYYTGSQDAPVFLGDQETPRNYYTVRDRENDGPFYFLPWDIEWCLESPYINRLNIVGVWNPHYLMDKLLVNPQFKLLLADRIHKHFHNDGALTREQSTARYLSRSDSIQGAIVGESARWGDAQRSSPYTHAHWQSEVDRLVNDFFATRTQTVLSQLDEKGWYPSVAAPNFNINGEASYNSPIQSGDLLTMANPDGGGIIYYTLDGSDPYQPLPQGQQAQTVTLLAENADKQVLVPLLDIGTDWQGGNEPYDASSWVDGQPVISTGAGAVGYEFGTDYGSLISYDLLFSMFGMNASCYIRISFTVNQADLDWMSVLLLKVRCDDGFVAYLNGQEIASLNRPEVLAWNSHCEYRPDSTDWILFTIDSQLDLLHAGENILAIHALNKDSASTDFLFSAELIGSEQALTELSPTAQAYADPIVLEGNTVVKARVLGSEWSALTESTYLLNDLND